MIGLEAFVAYFLAVSAVTALVNSLIGPGGPDRIARGALRFFVLIVLGIGAFSGLVYLLEWMFIPR